MIFPEDYRELGVRPPSSYFERRETDAMSHITKESDMENVIFSDPQTILDNAGNAVMNDVDLLLHRHVPIDSD